MFDTLNFFQINFIRVSPSVSVMCNCFENLKTVRNALLSVKKFSFRKLLKSISMDLLLLPLYLLVSSINFSFLIVPEPSKKQCKKSLAVFNPFRFKKAVISFSLVVSL
ncbi:MAG: hypothetical protein Q8N60_01060, partial [Candidatus Diapherotrites archaeon]|nr:hypothetical protein [Candidatus Diapherotrites archaeon]